MYTCVGVAAAPGRGEGREGRIEKFPISILLEDMGNQTQAQALYSHLENSHYVDYTLAGLPGLPLQPRGPREERQRRAVLAQRTVGPACPQLHVSACVQLQL
jgi:hypothetical protein